MTNEDLNAEFSISITKKAGDPQMRFTYDGNPNVVGSGLVRALVYFTVQAPDVDAAAKEIIGLYRELVYEYPQWPEGGET